MMIFTKPMLRHILELLQVPNDGNGLGKMDQRTKLIDVIEPRYGAYTREEGCNACLLASLSYSYRTWDMC